MFDLSDRREFLNLAGLFEGGMVGLTFALAWVAGIDPLESLSWQWSALVWGVAGTLPILLIFLLTHRFPVGPLLPIKRFLIELLGPSLIACRWYDLVLLAVLVGFAEELLFRGLLQPWLESFGYVAGLLMSNVLFGLAHFITPLYAFMASMIGGYLGILLDCPGRRNLLTPMLTHALYDYFAFLIVAASYRREQQRRGPSSATQPYNAAE